MIAYYSQSGHTEAVAKAIQQETGGDLYHIRTNIAYPKNAPAMQSQAKAEYNEGLRPSLAEPMPDMSRYDVVLLGFPNWYNAPPVGVFTFLEGTDWKGKTIVPFVTYGLSGWGSSIDDIRAAAPDAVLAKGLAVHASQAGNCKEAVASWLDSLGLDAIQGGRNR
nr:flavodoxin [Megasphaera sp. SW808]